MYCNVCCESYNKSKRTEVVCYIQSCKYTCCKDCVRKYLKSVASEPHCMNCRNKWSLEFCKEALNSSFMEHEYKEHRKNVITDMMIAKIPEHYEAALRFGGISDTHKKIDAIDEQISAHYLAIGQLNNERHALRRLLERPVATSRKFVMPCQTAGCRGMLSNHYKCDICTNTTCSKCYCIKKFEHECRPEDVATVEELKQNTRPCPNCGCRISKIDGCFGANIPIMLWSGPQALHASSTKMSQYIAVGDVLVGDDGTPRNVLSLVSGVDTLYYIQQHPVGKPYIVNSQHKLVLYYIGTGFGLSNGFDSNIVEMTVEEYLRLPNPEDYQGILRHYNIKSLTELTITKLGAGTYYGWTVDGNQRFLLGDKTVVHNCDQMWCVECKTAFSWNKGTIEHGTVHNPHYYQWIRERGNNMDAEQHNQICRDDFNMASQFINRLMSGYLDSIVLEENRRNDIKDLYYYLLRFHRFIVHLENVCLEPIVNNILDRNNTHTYIYLYILNQISKQTLANHLMDKQSANDKDIALRDILEAQIVIGKQIIIDCMHELENNISRDCTYECAVNILEKYKLSIIEYSAYMQTETIKFLMTYNCKKTICIWDIEYGVVADSQFKTRTQMNEHIILVQNLLKEYKNNVNVA